METQNARLEAAAEAQAVKMSKIELATNGMKDELVSATKAAAHAEGRASALSESKGDV
jgi:hypothetical protein